MKKPGESAQLGYWSDAEVDEGDVIRTSTGRRYLVVGLRRTGGRQPHWQCDTIVMHPDDADPDGATIHPLYWFRRERRQVR